MTASFPERFTAHNIRLDDGSVTRPGFAGKTIDELPATKAVANMARLIWPGGYAGKRIVDLGCLEGGFATAFARLGFDSTGIEVRQSNFENCMFVKGRVDLPNLIFQQDDAWNVRQYGPFDAVFCVGLLYHIEDPRRFLGVLSETCRSVLFVDTHFAPERDDSPTVGFHKLSALDMHEGLEGRWFVEHDLDPEADFTELDTLKWASWENRRSFWPTRPALLSAIREAGFDMVLEDFDPMGAKIVQHMGPGGFYQTHSRSMFVGIKLEGGNVERSGFLPPLRER